MIGKPAGACLPCTRLPTGFSPAQLPWTASGFGVLDGFSSLESHQRPIYRFPDEIVAAALTCPRLRWTWLVLPPVVSAFDVLYIARRPRETLPQSLRTLSSSVPFESTRKHLAILSCEMKGTD